MTLYHVTLTDNATSIMTYGVLRICCNRRVKRVWGVDCSRLFWAVAHVCDKYMCTADELTVFQLEIPDDMVTRHPTDGVWYFDGDWPAKYISRQFAVALLDVHTPADIINKWSSIG